VNHTSVQQMRGLRSSRVGNAIQGILEYRILLLRMFERISTDDRRIFDTVGFKLLRRELPCLDRADLCRIEQTLMIFVDTEIGLDSAEIEQIWLKTGCTIAQVWIGDVLSETIATQPVSMPVATETQVSAKPARSATPKTAPKSPELISIDELSTQISSVTGRDAKTVRTEIMAMNPTIYVDASTATAAIDNSIKALEAMRSRFNVSKAPTRTTAKKPAAKRGSKKV
jgi:hypothetical protein